jgi:hypothetical protein
MKIYKITEASEYLGVSINTLKTLANYSARFYGRRGGRKKKNTTENESNESNGI